jgi:hypothetical protein
MKLLSVTTIDAYNVQDIASKDIYERNQFSDNPKSLMEMREIKILCDTTERIFVPLRNQQEK